MESRAPLLVLGGSEILALEHGLNFSALDSIDLPRLTSFDAVFKIIGQI
jgi:hypothetical protein